MAVFVKVQRSRRHYRPQHLWVPTVQKLDFSITGSGGIVIGGTGLAGYDTRSGGVRVLSQRQGVRIL